MLLKKALTTTALATVLLTSSISANELTTQGITGSTAKVEKIGAFDNIPTENLNITELEVVGEGWRMRLIEGFFEWVFSVDTAYSD
jgi:hypothetical protein